MWYFKFWNCSTENRILGFELSLACVASVSVEQREKNGVFGVWLFAPRKCLQRRRGSLLHRISIWEIIEYCEWERARRTMGRGKGRKPLPNNVSEMAPDFRGRLVLGSIPRQYLQDGGIHDAVGQEAKRNCSLFPCDCFDRRKKTVRRYVLNALKETVLWIFFLSELNEVRILVPCILTLLSTVRNAKQVLRIATARKRRGSLSDSFFSWSPTECNVGSLSNSASKNAFQRTHGLYFFSGVLLIGWHPTSSCMWKKFKRGRKPGYFSLSTIKHKSEMADNNSKHTNDQKSVNQNRNSIKLHLLTS